MVKTQTSVETVRGDLKVLQDCYGQSRPKLKRHSSTIKQSSNSSIHQNKRSQSVNIRAVENKKSINNKEEGICVENTINCEVESNISLTKKVPSANVHKINRCSSSLLRKIGNRISPETDLGISNVIISAQDKTETKTTLEEESIAKSIIITGSEVNANFVENINHHHHNNDIKNGTDLSSDKSNLPNELHDQILKNREKNSYLRRCRGRFALMCTIGSIIALIIIGIVVGITLVVTLIKQNPITTVSTSISSSSSSKNTTLQTNVTTSATSSSNLITSETLLTSTTTTLESSISFTATLESSVSSTISLESSISSTTSIASPTNVTTSTTLLINATTSGTSLTSSSTNSGSSTSFTTSTRSTISSSTSTTSSTDSSTTATFAALSEGSRVNLTCLPPTPTIHIVSAYYGVPNPSVCNCVVSRCAQMNVTQNVTSYCANNVVSSSCTFVASNSFFSETCRGVAKRFWLTYYCS